MMNTLRRRTVSVVATQIVGITLLGLTAACSSPLPTAPDSPLTVASDPAGAVASTAPQAPAPSRARLAIASFDIEHVHDNPELYGYFLVGSEESLYLLHVSVTETTGANDAFITAIKPALEGSPRYPLPSVTYPLLRVPGSDKVAAGGGWNMEQQGGSLYGLEFAILSSEPSLVGRQASVVVEFKDSDGGKGVVSSTTTIR